MKMNKEEFIDLFTPYINKYGTVNNNPCNKSLDVDTGNGLLAYGEMCMMYKLLLGKDYPYDQINKVYMDHRKISGIMNRSGKDQDYISHDELLGFASIGNPWAIYIFRYGYYRKWCWNNVEFDKFSFRQWFYRFPWFIAHLKNCIGEGINIFEKLIWCVFILTNSKMSQKHGASEPKMAWLMIESYKLYGIKDSIMDLCVRYFESNTNPGWLFKTYYGGTHPLSICASRLSRIDI